MNYLKILSTILLITLLSNVSISQTFGVPNQSSQSNVANMAATAWINSSGGVEITVTFDMDFCPREDFCNESGYAVIRIMDIVFYSPTELHDGQTAQFSVTIPVAQFAGSSDPTHLFLECSGEGVEGKLIYDGCVVIVEPCDGC